MASNVEDPAPEIPDEEELPHAENENEEGAMTGVDSPEKNEVCIHLSLQDLFSTMSKNRGHRFNLH